MIEAWLHFCGERADAALSRVIRSAVARPSVFIGLFVTEMN